jgi:hypothetical protein
MRLPISLLIAGLLPVLAPFASAGEGCDCSRDRRERCSEGKTDDCRCEDCDCHQGGECAAASCHERHT